MSRDAVGDVKAGIRLSFFGTLATGVLQFVLMTVLARLLTPTEYGVYALCVAIVAISATFVINVIERLLVLSEAEGDDSDESAAIFLICIAASALALAAAFAINSFAARGIDLGVLAIVAGSACIASMGVMPRVVLRRKLRFGAIVGAELAALLVGQGLVTVSLAIAGWGSYALAVGACAQSLVIAGTLRIYRPGSGLRAPNIARCLKLVRRATALGGSVAAEVVNGQIAPLAIGARLGAFALGLFNRSYSLVQMPIQLLVASMNRVVVSALFSVSADRERLRSASRSLAMVAAAVATPVAAGMAGASENFVLVAFGPRWAAASEIMPFIAIGAWAVMMGAMLAIIAEALREFVAKMRVQVVSSVVLLALILFGAEAGLQSAVAGIAVGSCLFMLLYVRLVARLLELPFLAVAGWFVPGLVIGIPCYVASFAFAHYLPFPPIGILTAQVAACAAIVAGMLVFIFPGLALRIAEVGAPFSLRMMPALAHRLQNASQNRKS